MIVRATRPSKTVETYGPVSAEGADRVVCALAASGRYQQVTVDSAQPEPGLSEAQHAVVRKLVRDEIRLIISRIAQSDWRGVANL